MVKRTRQIPCFVRPEHFLCRESRCLKVACACLRKEIKKFLSLKTEFFPSSTTRKYFFLHRKKHNFYHWQMARQNAFHRSESLMEQMPPDKGPMSHTTPIFGSLFSIASFSVVRFTKIRLRCRIEGLSMCAASASHSDISQRIF